MKPGPNPADDSSAMPESSSDPVPRFKRTVCVIGGAGHVGLPLAMTFADVGHQTLIYDINRQAIARIREGQMPFVEDGGPEMLAAVLERGRLEVDDAPASLSTCEFLVMIVGTPVDEHLNPSFSGIQRASTDASSTCDGQL